jgi:hypothetical protein
MKKKKKDLNHNTLPGEGDRDCQWLERLPGQARNLFPGKNEWEKRLAWTLVEWADEERAYELEQFFWKYRIQRRNFNAQVERSPYLTNIVETVKIQLGSRKRIGALEGKLTPSMAMRDQHMLDPEQDKINKYHALLKNIEEKTEQGIRVVYIEKTTEEDCKKPGIEDESNTKNLIVAE